MRSFTALLKNYMKSSLKDLTFFLIRASYAVNYDYVAPMKYKELFLVYKAIPLPISQVNRNDIRERYSEIIRKRGGDIMGTSFTTILFGYSFVIVLFLHS